MKSIEEKVLEIVNNNIEDTEINIEQARDDLSGLGMDSILFIRMVSALEEAFNIEVPDEYLLVPEMNTVEKIVNIVSETMHIQEGKVYNVVKNGNT